MKSKQLFLFSTEITVFTKSNTKIIYWKSAKRLTVIVLAPS